MRVRNQPIEISCSWAKKDPENKDFRVRLSFLTIRDCEEGFFRDIRYVLIDRDTKFCPFRGVLEGGDQEALLLPPRSPNLNVCLANIRPH